MNDTSMAIIESVSVRCGKESDESSDELSSHGEDR